MQKDNDCNDSPTEVSIFTSQQLYTELGSDDVLLGRGTGPNEFEGNIRFRRLIGEIAMSTDPRELVSSKSSLAQKVVDEVALRGGKFVRKLSKAEVVALLNTSASKGWSINQLEKGKDMYIEVSTAVAIEKAKQSFRHQQRIMDRHGETSISKGLGRGMVSSSSHRKPTAIAIKKVTGHGSRSSVDDMDDAPRSARHLTSLERIDDNKAPSARHSSEVHQGVWPPSAPTRSFSFAPSQQLAQESSSQHRNFTVRLGGGEDPSNDATTLRSEAYLQQQLSSAEAVAGIDLASFIAYQLSQQRNDVASSLASTTTGSTGGHHHPQQLQNRSVTMPYPLFPLPTQDPYSLSMLSLLRAQGVLSSPAPQLLSSLSSLLAAPTGNHHHHGHPATLPPPGMITMGLGGGGSSSTTSGGFSTILPPPRPLALQYQHHLLLSALGRGGSTPTVLGGEQGPLNSALLASLGLQHDNPLQERQTVPPPSLSSMVADGNSSTSTRGTTSAGGETRPIMPTSNQDTTAVSSPAANNDTVSDPQATGSLLDYILGLRR